MSRNKKLQELLDRLAGTRVKPNPKEEAEAAPGDETAKSGRKAEDGCEGEQICTAPADAGGENNADNSDNADNADGSDSGDSNGSHDSYERAAMMLGEAMLERVGIPEGINPIAVVVTLLQRMANEDDNTDGPKDGPDGPKDSPDSMNAKRNAMLPRPIRGSMGQAPETDYESMSSEDFRKLRRQLKKASMDGRRVRI
ncbi:MAG: hypothetical protein MR899_01850 [Clostridium sp.]|nr:hypothetical protein [Clostridium sp.]